MTTRNWVQVGVLAALALIYVIFFTEWLRPAPILIASQVRFATQPQRFGRPARKAAPSRAAFTQNVDQVVWMGTTGGVVRFNGTNQFVQKTFQMGGTGQVMRLRTNALAVRAKEQAKPPRVKPGEEYERVGLPEKGGIDQAPGGVANVTFSLDDWYQLTRLRVEDVPADGTAPNVVWQLVGKSLPLDSLLYNRVPTGMKPLVEGANAEPLKPGVPYRLIVEAGRRRGTNYFQTVELHPAD